MGTRAARRGFDGSGSAHVGELPGLIRAEFRDTNNPKVETELVLE